MEETIKGRVAEKDSENNSKRDDIEDFGYLWVMIGGYANTRGMIEGEMRQQGSRGLIGTSRLLLKWFNWTIRLLLKWFNWD